VAIKLKILFSVFLFQPIGQMNSGAEKSIELIIHSLCHKNALIHCPIVLLALTVSV
jgi:hypothetical protein